MRLPHNSPFGRKPAPNRGGRELPEMQEELFDEPDDYLDRLREQLAAYLPQDLIEKLSTKAADTLLRVLYTEIVGAASLQREFREYMRLHYAHLSYRKKNTVQKSEPHVFATFIDEHVAEWELALLRTKHTAVTERKIDDTVQNDRARMLETLENLRH